APVLIALLVVESHVVQTQNQNTESLIEPSFEVASIRPIPPDQQKSVERRISTGPGRFVMSNHRVKDLIIFPHPTESSDGLGAPPWVEAYEVRYSVEAITAPEATPQQVQAMARRLLRERFGFAAHYEKEERPVFFLRMAREDAQPGPELRKVDVDC